MRTTASSKLLSICLLHLIFMLFTTTTAQLGFKCNSSITARCEAMVGYVCPNATTLSNITTLFGLEGGLHSLLVANSFPLDTPPNRPVASKQTIRIPFNCTCSNGTGISDRRPIYKVIPNDGLDNIARYVFSFLVTYQQIAAVNKISNPDMILIGQELWIPLPCSCDPVDGVKVIHYAQVVQLDSSLEMIAEEFGTTREALLKLNGLDNDPKALTVIDVPYRPRGKKKKSSNIVIIVVVLSVITMLWIITIWYFCFRRKKKATKEIDDVDELQAESMQFNFTTIRDATNNFSDANELGKGGFGFVYKGTLPDGQQIAVKRLSRNSGQGEQEFKNEVGLVARLQHRNLVRLLGFCLHGEERLLIYEFMPNGSLDQFIFDPIKRTHLDWERRYKIIGGIARGLLYLHEDSRLRIIHRDLKASNVLLGDDMNPKISDFGMARMFLVNQTQASTNRIVGTYGYMAPEYAMHGHFSVKSDVFSFGVLILEILSGQRNNSFYECEGAQDLLSYTWRHWKEGTALELLDPTLRDNCSIIEVMRCIQIGLLCVQEDIADRPTMASVVYKLNNYSVTLNTPLSPPAYFVHIRKEHDMPLRESQMTVNEASITELDPR